MAFTQIEGRNTWYEDQVLTAAAPTTIADGIPLQNLDGLTVQVQANATRTLSGAGSLRCYIWDPDVALWSRLPENDLAVSTASVRCLAFAPFAMTSPSKGSRVCFVTDSVTVSAGTTVRVNLIGYCAATRRA